MSTLLSSDASIDLYTIDVGSTRTAIGWPGGMNLVPANQVNGQVVEYVNVYRDLSFIGPLPADEYLV